MAKELLYLISEFVQQSHFTDFTVCANNYLFSRVSNSAHETRDKVYSE